MKKICLKTWSVLCGVLFTLTLQAQSLTPNRGEQNQIQVIEIRGFGTNISNNPIYKNNQNYKYIGDTLIFDSPLVLLRVSSQPIIKVNVLSYKQIDSFTANVTIKLPQKGSYGIKSNNQYLGNFLVYNNFKTIDFKPNYIIKNEPLKVTITGNNTKLGRGITCANDTNCRVIGDYLYFSQGSTTISEYQLTYGYPTVPVLINSYSQIDDKTVELLINFQENNTNTFNFPTRLAYISTTNNLYADNNYSAYTKSFLPIVNKSFSITPNGGFQFNKIKIKLSGKYTNIGQGNSCKLDPNCKEIGDTLIYSGYQSTGKLVLENYVQIDESTAEAFITLPKEGIYTIKTKDGILADNILEVWSPTIQLTPSIIKENVISEIKITGRGLKIGNKISCVDDNLCFSIDDSLRFSGMYSGSVAIQKLRRIDDNNILLSIRMPQKGLYQLRNQKNIFLGEINVIPSSFDIYPTVWQENVPITVTLKGVNTKLSNSESCKTDSSCSYIGDTIYFSELSYFDDITAKQKINNYLQINDSTVQITFLTPSGGNYFFNTNKTAYSRNNLYLETNSLYYYGYSNDKCKFSESSIYLNFTGLPPWNVKYTDGTNLYEIKDIKDRRYNLNINPIVNTNFIFTEVSNPYGVGTVSGSARFTVNSDTAARAYLSRVDSATNNLSIKFKIELKGKAPWQVYMNIGGENDTSFTVSTSPYFLSIKPKSFTTFKINYVIDNSFCGNGTAYGSVNYAPGDIVTELNSFDNTLQTNIYPNPTTGIVNLENAISATLFNSLGEEMLKTTGTKIDISHMPNGLYYIQALDAKNKLSSVKIVKE